MKTPQGTGLELRLIGPMALLRQGSELPLPASRKTRALLAYLAITGQAESRERLCELFWEVPDDPRGSLRWSLSQLRKALEEDAGLLDAGRERVAFRPPSGACDWHRLRDAATDANGDVGEAVPNDGDLLEGLDLPSCDIFQSWLVGRREELRRWRIAMLARGAANAQDIEVRIEQARAWTAIDRFSPAAWQALVGLLDEARRVDEAAQQRAIAIRLLEEAREPVPLVLRYPGQRTRAETTPDTGAARQRIRFCRSADGTGLAYAIGGSGPPIVKTANWMGHLELDWQTPVWPHWFETLSDGRMLVRYDQRGNGLSDWNTTFSFAAYVADLEAVVDAAGIERFDLFGVSQGAAVAIAYAAAHPERVRRMILFGGFAQGWDIRGTPEDRARHEAMMTLTLQGWGLDNAAYRQLFTSLLLPDATPVEQDAFNDMQRHATSPVNAVAIQRENAKIDVRPLLPRLRVPTLVAHCREDAMVPFAAGRLLACEIPDARFVPLDSRNHLLLAREPAWAKLSAEMRAFLNDETES